MRTLRSIALLAVIGAAYFAQAILDRGALDGFFPVRLIAVFPYLLKMSRWLPRDLLAFALWLAVVAALGFGLVSPLWRGDQRAPRRGKNEDISSAWPSWASPALVAAAYLAIVAATAGIRVVPMPPALSHTLWLGGLILYVAAGALASPRQRSSEPRSANAPAPLRGWPWAIAILVIAAVLMTVRWDALPARIDAVTAYAGLQADTLLQGGVSWFEPAELPVPALASVATALGQAVTGDALLGARIAGLYAGLLLVTAVWLLGGELFRRRPLLGEFGEVIEDDGRLPALIAAAIAAGGAPFLLSARLPLFLEAVAWGTLGLWALLFSLRHGSLALLGVSGLLLGLAAAFGPNGLSMIGVAILFWAGILILWPGWMQRERWANNRRLAAVVAYWAGGVLAVALPVFVGVGGASGGVSAYLSANLIAESYDPAWQSVVAQGAATPDAGFLADLQTALLAPNAGADRSALLMMNGSMLSSLLAPFFVLALGALLMSVDTLLGWTLLSWFLAGAAFSVLWAHPVAPHWPSLLVIWPAVALTTAFGLDRLRVTAMISFGTWLMQASIYLVAGLVIGAAMLNWVSFFGEGQVHVDPASAVAREVRRAGSAGQSVVVVSSSPLTASASPVAALLGRESHAASGSVREYTPQALPDSLPSGVRLVLPAGDLPALERALSLYPRSRPVAQRDLGGNPSVYVIEVGQE